LSGLVKPEKTKFGFAVSNNGEGSGLISKEEQPNVQDLANNRIVRKYERRLVRNGQWEVEERDQKQISKLFDNFKQRTGASKAVSFPKSEGLFGKIFGADSNPEPQTQVSTTNPEISDAILDNTKPQNSTEIGDSISQMLFNSRLSAFKSKTEKFAAKAESINKQIKGIGATISKGAHGDDEKQLYEDIMKAHELKILLRSRVADSNQRAKPKKKAPRHSSKYRTKNPKIDPDDEDLGDDLPSAKADENGTKLTCISFHYWPEMNYLILGFLSREIWIYELQYEFKLKIKFLEELRLKGYPNNISITKSVFHDCYFIIIVLNFNFLKIYRFYLDKTSTKNFKLLPSVTEQNCLYSAEFNMLTLVKTVRDFTVLCDIRNNVFVIKQTGPEKFQMIKKINIQEKTTSFT
jgi:hypothetical protein